MKTSIGKFDAATRSVLVTFEHAGVTHKRNVNACLDADGGYDKAATKDRVAEVAQGVAHKIDLGVIKAEDLTPIAGLPSDDAPPAAAD